MLEVLKTKSNGVHTYRLGNVIRKVYFGNGIIYQDPENDYNDYFDYEEHLYTKNLQQHINIMNKVMPGYILQHGSFKKNAYFVDSKFFLGKCLKDIRQNFSPSGLRYTKDFIKKFRSFCIESARKTFPYSHGDWTPDNVLEYNGEWFLIDWDWVGQRTTQETQRILNLRLKQVFGYDVDIVTKRELSFMENY